MDNLKTNEQNKKAIENLSDKEKEIALKILEEIKQSGNSDIYNNLIYSDYKEIPVDIETFADDNNYLGYAWHDNEGKTKLYPYWRKKLREIFPNNLDTDFNNIILSGARGRGKSEIAVLILCYMMYRVMCLKEPLTHFHMKPTEKICFAFMNIKLALAEEIANTKFQNTVKMSPWFLSHGKIEGRTNQLWVPNPEHCIDIKIGSQADDLIGLPCFGIFFDEISFIRNQDIDKQKAKAIDMIDTAIGGMKTRFIYKGKNPTVLILASSKRSEKSFLEEHMKKKLESEKENVFISDGSVWEVKPEGTYNNKTFFIAVGNKFLQSRIVPEGDNPADWIQKGYKVIECPIDFKPNFIDDMDRALCDYAGISSSELSKYISGEAVQECINSDLRNPFISDTIEVGNSKEDKAEYKNFFDLSKIPVELKSKPLFIHLDMSISGDMTGIAGVWIKGKKPSTDSNSGKDLMFQLAFSISIKAPKGYQISFEKNRNFIRWLKSEGFNIKKITSDTFQSYDLQQQLKSEGYDCDILSVDRVDASSHICIPYQYLKSTIYEKRLSMYSCERLIEEFTDLERNINTGKVDHPTNGHKDMSDAVCLHGDTEIYLLSGKHKKISDLYDNFENEWVLSYNTETNKIEPVKIQNVINNGIKNNLIKLTLDNGKELICTDDHLILTRDGSYIKARDTLNISLMPFNYENRIMYKNRDYQYISHPNSDLTTTGVYLHKLVAESEHLQEKLDKEAKLPVDCLNYELTERVYKNIQKLGNCVKLFLKEANKKEFTYNEFLTYYYNKLSTDKYYYKRFKNIPLEYNLILRLGFKLYNHRVIKIEPYCASNVYDLQLGKIHNFALLSGVFVHNCGATFSASKYADNYAYDYGEDLDIMLQVNEKVVNPELQQLTVGFEEELKRMQDPLANYRESNQSQPYNYIITDPDIFI